MGYKFKGKKLIIEALTHKSYKQSFDNERLEFLGDEVLKQIAIELTQKLRSSISVDWQQRESVRAKMRNIIRIILKRFRYPPDKALEAMDMVMKQAEVLSDEWSR